MAASMQRLCFPALLLSFLRGPAAVGAARIVDAGSSESTGRCGCGSGNHCLCSTWLEEAGIDLSEKAAEICPKAMKMEGSRIRRKEDVSKYDWGKQISDGEFKMFKGMINQGAEMENDKCLKHGSCFQPLYIACKTHYGCKLSDAPNEAWGLCDKVFVSKEWSMTEAGLQLFRNGKGQLWCSEEDIEAHCGKTKADIPQFPNECSRAFEHLEDPALTLCSSAFKYEGPEAKALKDGTDSLPPQFQRAGHAMMGFARYMEKKRNVHKGTCFPWLLHVCEGHYQKKGCELGDDLKPKVCEHVFTEGSMSVEQAAAALFRKGLHWCTVQDIKQACGKE